MYKKKGLPEEGDLVVCTVTKVEKAAVFVDLDEYDAKGVIRIDEVVAGRIRTLKGIVEPGRKVVCKVLRVDPNTKILELSIRRVSEGLKRQKLAEYKREQIAIQLVESLSKKLGISIEEAHKILDKLYEYTDLLYPFFQEVILKGPKLLKEAGVPEQYIEPLYELIKQRIPPPIYTKEGEVILQVLHKEGIIIIKNILLEASKRYNVKWIYYGAPRYGFKIETGDPKELNQKYKEFKEYLEKEAEKYDAYLEIKEK